jgi:hypothetical protein
MKLKKTDDGYKCEGSTAIKFIRCKHKRGWKVVVLRQGGEQASFQTLEEARAWARQFWRPECARTLARRLKKLVLGQEENSLLEASRGGDGGAYVSLLDLLEARGLLTASEKKRAVAQARREGLLK